MKTNKAQIFTYLLHQKKEINQIKLWPNFNLHTFEQKQTKSEKFGSAREREPIMWWSNGIRASVTLNKKRQITQHKLSVFL